MDKNPLLNRPINLLGLSNDFLSASKTMGFGTISEVIDTGLIDLVNKEGFNYHWLAELIEVLNKEGLLHLLQPLPGSIPG